VLVGGDVAGAGVDVAVSMFEADAILEAAGGLEPLRSERSM